MKNILRPLLILITLSCVSVTQGQQQSTLPARDEPTLIDLKEQIADCTINTRADAKYVAKLKARITELEKSLATLQAGNSSLNKAAADRK